MPDPNPAVMEFLLTRRSRPAKTLQAPAPDRDTLMRILTAAARSPDHGKLEPWRFMVLEGAALQRIAGDVQACGERLGKDEDAIAKAVGTWANSPLCVAVIDSPVLSEKVPEIEQTYSVGAVCLAALNAAHAEGFGANWLSGWASHDRAFVETALGLAPRERIAGFIHIGTERIAPPERPRPDLAAKVAWVDQ